MHNTLDAVRVVADPGQSGDGVLELRVYSEDTNGDAAGGVVHRTGEVMTGSLIGPANGSGFNATFGYFEARVKLDFARRTHGAFWMLSSFSQHDAPLTDPEAAGPEIDIFELGHPLDGDANADGRCDWPVLGVPCDRILSGGKHWDGFRNRDFRYAVLPSVAGSPADPFGGRTTTVGAFNTWGLLWTPEGYRMFFNGTPFYESSEAITYNPEHLILSMYQDGDNPPVLPATGYGPLGASTNSVMSVDYVSVWQRPVSEVPDRTVAVNSPVSVPVSVTDYFYAHPGIGEPEPVRVAAVSGNQAVVGSDRIVVSGNPTRSDDLALPGRVTADPDGSLANAGFEAPLSPAWTATGSASVSTAKRHAGSGSLRLTESGGRVEQTISGLQPNTRYTIGGYANQELSWYDANHNGRIDWVDSDRDGRCESSDAFETIVDPKSEFDWGIVDTDTAVPGPQEIRETQSRNAWVERCEYWSPHRDDWRHRTLGFTTGATTTAVTLFIDNTRYVSPDERDSNLNVDSIYIRPALPSTRTVTLRPNDNVAGSAPITLTAWVDSDRDGQRGGGEPVLGTEQFTVTFTAGSTFTNGDFEAGAGSPAWELLEGLNGGEVGRGAAVVVADSFRLNRVLELGGPAAEPVVSRRALGVARQPVRNLKPSTSYTLSVTGKGTDLGFTFFGAASDPCAAPAPADACKITNPNAWTTKSVTFTTDGTGTGAVVLADWSPSTPSFADNIRLTTTASGLPAVPVVAPALSDLDGQVQPISSSTTTAVAVTVPAGATIDWGYSDNPSLLPARNVGISAGGTTRVLSLTPVAGRTGNATIVVYFTMGGGSGTVSIPVVVSDQHLTNPGFEQGMVDWTGGSPAPSGQHHSGTAALALPDTGEAVKQTIVGLPYRVEYALGGWNNGPVTVTVRDLDKTPDPNPPAPATWSGSGWTHNQLVFPTNTCGNCRAAGSLSPVGGGALNLVDGARVEIAFSDANPNDGIPVFIDDLTLFKMPAMWDFQPFSMTASQTGWQTNDGLSFTTGQVSTKTTTPSTTPWIPAVAQVTTSDPVKLPLANIRVVRYQAGHPYRWQVQLKANGSTCTCAVNLTLTDPATGLSVHKGFFAIIT